MKSLFIFLITLSTFPQLQAQSWEWSPELPKAGEIVSVKVKDLDMKDNMHIVSYTFHGKDLITTDIHFLTEDEGIHINIPVPSESNWIRFVIKDEDGQPVAGDQKLVIKDGAPAKSGQVEQAIAESYYSRPMGLKTNKASTTALYREAVQSEPIWFDNAEVLAGYYNMAKASKSEDDLKMIRTHLLTLDADKNIESPDVLIRAIRITKDMGDTLLSKSLRKKLDTDFPQSQLSQDDQLTRFGKAEKIEDKIEIRKQFKSTFSINDQNTGIYDQMTSSLVEEFATQDDWDQAELYIGEILNPATKASVCNNYAWTLAGEGLENEAPNLDVAARLSALSICCLTPDLKKPPVLSKREWEENLEYSKAMYGDTYALILFKQGKYSEALDHQSFAVKTSKYADLEMNERYVLYLEKAGHQDELLTFIDEMMEMGKASEKMKEIHKRIWTSDKTPDQLYSRYVTKLEAKAKENRLEKIQSMWMNVPAASFTLKNLKGDEVSLSDYKGKTVILDFWATWCGPCKASFPGMKKAVEHYAQDKNVVFLFIDTWENGDNIEGKVNTFIKDNNYPFHVLMDIKNQVVANFMVDGIPTKFIIDKDQKIRFKAIGYSGSTEGLLEEIITMIELAQNGGKLEKS